MCRKLSKTNLKKSVCPLYYCSYASLCIDFLFFSLWVFLSNFSTAFLSTFGLSDCSISSQRRPLSPRIFSNVIHCYFYYFPGLKHTLFSLSMCYAWIHSFTLDYGFSIFKFHCLRTTGFFLILVKHLAFKYQKLKYLPKKIIKLY